MITLEEVAEFINSSECQRILSNRRISSNDISRLGGGLVNFVYRLSFEDSTTAVLKHFPPYVANNPKVPFSQERYFAEKECLRLFGGTHGLLSVPRLIHSDDAKFTIIMEDAGKELSTLLDHLRADAIVDEAIFPKVADSIQAFLHELNQTPPTAAFSNPSAWTVLNDHVTDSYRRKAKELNIETDLEPFLKYVKPFAPPAENGHPIFGDLWPNAILIHPQTHQIWLLDWEMARLGEDTVDFNQLLCNLWLMTQNSRDYNVKNVQKVMAELHRAFLGSTDRDWREDEALGISFVITVLEFVQEKHYGIDDPAKTMLYAAKEVEEIRKRKPFTSPHGDNALFIATSPVITNFGGRYLDFPNLDVADQLELPFPTTEYTSTCSPCTELEMTPIEWSPPSDSSLHSSPFSALMPTTGMPAGSAMTGFMHSDDPVVLEFGNDLLSGIFDPPLDPNLKDFEFMNFMPRPASIFENGDQDMEALINILSVEPDKPTKPEAVTTVQRKIKPRPTRSPSRRSEQQKKTSSPYQRVSKSLSSSSSSSPSPKLRSPPPSPKPPTSTPPAKCKHRQPIQTLITSYFYNTEVVTKKVHAVLKVFESKLEALRAAHPSETHFSCFLGSPTNPCPCRISVDKNFESHFMSHIPDELRIKAHECVCAGLSR
ncbi:hypothetical protein HDU97_001251, partial [Phlyctochytrium planicorne]